MQTSAFMSQAVIHFITGVVHLNRVHVFIFYDYLFSNSTLHSIPATVHPFSLEYDEMLILKLKFKHTT